MKCPPMALGALRVEVPTISIWDMGRAAELPLGFPTVEGRLEHSLCVAQRNGGNLFGPSARAGVVWVCCDNKALRRAASGGVGCPGWGVVARVTWGSGAARSIGQTITIGVLGSFPVAISIAGILKSFLFQI